MTTEATPDRKTTGRNTVTTTMPHDVHTTATADKETTRAPLSTTTTRSPPPPGRCITSCQTKKDGNYQVRFQYETTLVDVIFTIFINF